MSSRSHDDSSETLAAFPVHSVLTLTPCPTAVGILLSTLLIGGSRIASAQLQTQHQARAETSLIHVGGVNMSSRCDGCLSWRFANTESRNDGSLFVAHGSRRSHVLIGLLGGLVAGAATGAIIANNSAKRCHGESCQVSAALGGVADVVDGGLAGALAGAVVGAVWPVSK